MSFNSTSPTNYGFEGDPLLEAYMNAKFSEEISERMKVPKRIVMSNNHEMQVDNNEILNGNGTNSWNYYDKLDMTVPDRIVVIGQDQHLGEMSFLTLNFQPLSLPPFHFHFARFIYIQIARPQIFSFHKISDFSKIFHYPHRFLFFPYF